MTYLQTYTIQSQVYISIFLGKYTYKNIILYIVKSSLRFMFFKKLKKKSLKFMSLFINTLLCLSLTCLIIAPKFGLKFDLFTKQTNIYIYIYIYIYFLSLNSNCS